MDTVTCLWCNMAKPQLSLVVVNLQLNPRRGRCTHLAATSVTQLCSTSAGAIVLFSVLMYPSADGRSDFGVVPTFACFPAWLEASSSSP